jgi:hypothetical protein
MRGREEDQPLASALAKLHFESLSEDDFSKQLGPRAIVIFYEELLRSGFGRAFYSRHSNGEIISVCCVFSDYPSFRSKLITRLLPLTLSSLLSGRLSISSVVAELRRQRGCVPSSFGKFHLGMVIRNSRFGPAATKRLIGNFAEGMDYLSRMGAHQLWASSLATNREALVFLRGNGFVEFDRREDTVYLTRHLGPD